MCHVEIDPIRAMTPLCWSAMLLSQADQREYRFPHGHTGSEAERKRMALQPELMGSVGGRHTVDANEPGVLRASQYAASQLATQKCLRHTFPQVSGVDVRRIVKAEAQLLTVSDIRYFLVIDLSVATGHAPPHTYRTRPAEAAAGDDDDGPVACTVGVIVGKHGDDPEKAEMDLRGCRVLDGFEGLEGLRQSIAFDGREQEPDGEDDGELDLSGELRTQ